jgi:hypothetical protein
MPLSRQRITSETSLTKFRNLIRKQIIRNCIRKQQYNLCIRVNRETKENNSLITEATEKNVYDDK